LRVQFCRWALGANPLEQNPYFFWNVCLWQSYIS